MLRTAAQGFLQNGSWTAVRHVAGPAFAELCASRDRTQNVAHVNCSLALFTRCAAFCVLGATFHHYDKATRMSTQQPFPLQNTGATFADRIRLLIQHVGSATEIARMCGFSEGVVRSWRDGNTDPSRARCVTLARTLGISLLWLVAGEGPMIPGDPATNPADEQPGSELPPSQQPRAKQGSVTQLPRPAHANTLDTQRLNTAMQMLQSALELARSPLNMGECTDLLTDLYDITGPGGSKVDADAMMNFNRHLAQRIGKNRKIAV